MAYEKLSRFVVFLHQIPDHILNLFHKEPKA